MDVDRLFLDACDKAEMVTIYEAVSACGVKAEALGDDKDGYDFYWTLHRAFDCACHLIVPGETYGPQIDEASFTAEQLGVVERVLTESKDGRLKAWLADFLLEYYSSHRSGNVEMAAKRAFEFYLASPINIATYPENNDMATIRRMFQIASKYGCAISDGKNRAIGRIRCILSPLVSNKDSRFVCDVAETLKICKVNEAIDIVGCTLLRIADQCNKDKDYMGQEDCLEKLLELNPPNDMRNMVMVALAEAYKKEADYLPKNNDSRICGRMPFLYEQAIKYYKGLPEDFKKSIGFNKEKDGALRKLMNEWTKKMVKVCAHTIRIPLPGHTDVSLIDKFRKECVCDQLFELAQLSRIPEESIVAANASACKGKVWNFAFPIEHIDSEGRKTLQVRPPWDSNGDKNAEAYKVDRAFVLGLNALGESVFYPIYAIILKQKVHENFDRKTLIQLVEKAPLIPENHRVQFAEGIMLGLEGNMIAAVAVLIPQIEAIIRNLLANNGAVVAHFGKDGVEEVQGLSTLLENDKLKDLLDDTLLFDLKQMFCREPALNLRNRYQHGTVSDSELNKVESLYIWILALRFLFYGVEK